MGDVGRLQFATVGEWAGAGEWNRLVAALPGAHVLQTAEWAQVKARLGWRPLFVTWDREQRYSISKDRPPAGDPSALAAAALILQRAIPVGGFAARLRILYAPKGPLLDWSDAPLRRRVLGDLHDLARKQGAFLLKIDPDVDLGVGIPGTPEAQENPAGVAVAADLGARGWRFSDEQIQFKNTVCLDLTTSEDDLLARMKQKTRYNIRLAERKGVTVRIGASADFSLLYRMYAETSVRDGFVIRDETYYRTVWQTFQKSPSASASDPLAEPLIAEVTGEPVAAVFVFRFARRAWYIYGMSREAHREKMPNYLLQWEAMRRAKAAGCVAYDLWGAPDEFVESDPMWGVYRFKEGLGGEVVRRLGAWDLPVTPWLYRLYAQTLPKLLAVMRRRGKAETRKKVLGGA
jgi:lipid II:glycine glycyltransferase (peptidoglycan interpeptide bridge formation enzyme)